MLNSILDASVGGIIASLVSMLEAGAGEFRLFTSTWSLVRSSRITSRLKFRVAFVIALLLT
jgi:hypothetical protein